MAKISCTELAKISLALDILYRVMENHENEEDKVIKDFNKKMDGLCDVYFKMLDNL